MNKLFLLVGLLFIVPIVSAQLIITPVNSDVSVYKGQNSVFSVNLTNNNTFKIYNVTFTNPNVNYFSFATVDSLDPGETRLVAYSVKTDNIFNMLYVSTVSFLYPIEYNLTPKNFDINVTDAGFSPNNVTIMQNDSVSWHNLIANQSDVRDLGTSFPGVSLGAGSTVVQSYTDVASYVFYEYPVGFTGSLNVIPRSNVVFAHDSSMDVPMTIFVHSSLNPSTLQLNILTYNFTTNDNQTQYGVLEIKNAENIPLYNVVLNDSRGWTLFAENNFTLNPLQNKLVNFNVTPKVYTTAETNTTLIDKISGVSTNGGNTSGDLMIRINYYNFDLLNINGTLYTINVLGINATIDACLQHFGESGFEMCQKLKDAFQTNVTVIQEVPATLTVTEDQAKAGFQSVQDVNQGFQRVENLYNRLYDSVQIYTEIANNNSRAELSRDQRQQTYEDETNRTMHNRNVRDLIIIIAIIVFFMISWASKLMDLNEEFRLRLATLQE